MGHKDLLVTHNSPFSESLEALEVYAYAKRLPPPAASFNAVYHSPSETQHGSRSPLVVRDVSIERNHLM
ncbi:hypothetical protein SBA6_320003 [Candidatus Sulfopaludibacter sp. SbA6]|nr:hypothetical protein SBA6_320003 [Candidatus Sulfopaludibacter sp. SbA6]